MHGWRISDRIQQVSEGDLQVNQGSFYGSLHRLTREGWIRSEWGRTSQLGDDRPAAEPEYGPCPPSNWTGAPIRPLIQGRPHPRSRMA